jgi:hypothetical protein
MSELLTKIDTAVATLRAAGCVRAGAGWLTRDGIALPGDPLEAARALRHSTIKRAVEARQAGERQYFTR